MNKKIFLIIVCLTIFSGNVFADFPTLPGGPTVILGSILRPTPSDEEMLEACYSSSSGPIVDEGVRAWVQDSINMYYAGTIVETGVGAWPTALDATRTGRLCASVRQCFSVVVDAGEISVNTLQCWKKEGTNLYHSFFTDTDYEYNPTDGSFEAVP